MKRFLRYSLFLLVTIVVLILGLVGFLTLREYRPAEVTALNVTAGTHELAEKQDLSFVTYNIGYGGLGATEDFFMDGGRTVQPKDKTMITTNLTGISDTLKNLPADIYLLQEVDRQSKRSFGINQEKYLSEQLNLDSVFAYNFKVDFVPFPWPPIGRVASGIMTMTDAKMTEAKRLSLPSPFTWPVSTSNLKRALLETRFPLKNSPHELVVFNLHLEAYDNGEGKIAQRERLTSVLEKEYQKGNYVIAGGDFNQVFEGSQSFPELKQDGWQPGRMSARDLPTNFSFAYDTQHPTVRVLNAPYTGSYETSQVYSVDGFIVSNNIKVKKTEVIDVGFKHTDHQPVKLTVSLNE
ncbi:endonuclease [Vagococcus penaei]|uniref:Endonuclease n=1 Tax=Vagococcus penaei TaxID=633807 RepID=A0A1Q2D5P4_9ENTE|nr:endonuclease/exonuclease/phosphatase family protein [Vagococcus penaei]AQP53615.1 endonuclease [Vagococcus penaei]RSU07560.1 endonuclease [Vagococcus penaei]